MTIESLMSTLASLSALVLIVGSMLAMGMGLSISQIIGPLKNARLVILALLGNFVLVPLLAFVISRVMNLDEGLKTGLILVSVSAGAPFLVKEVQAANGKLGLAVGLMFLLMITTVFYVPVVLPLLLPGASIDPWSIAKSLIVTMLIPLIIGLMVHSYLPEDAKSWGLLLNKVASLAMLLMFALGLGLNLSNIIDLIGSRGFLALFLFLFGALAIGFLLGGRDPGERTVMGLGTAQRNVTAAILVSSLNFAGTITLPFVLVAAIILPMTLVPLARWLGRGGEQAEAAPAPPQGS